MLKQAKLDEIVESFDYSHHRENDPVKFVWQYDSCPDREVAGVVASSLAYGRIDVFEEAIEEALSQIGSSPANAILNNFKQVESGLESFSYRMTKGEDLIDLLSGLSFLLERYGTLEGAYQSFDEDSHIEKASCMVQEIRKGRKRDEVNRGLKYLMSDPKDGSACKRLNLFFRWMVRGPDSVDLGIWDEPDPSELIIPLDTHVHKISRKLDLTDRKSKSIKTAKDITDTLKNFDAQDPLQYDFALCHIGVEGNEEVFDDLDRQFEEDS